MFKIFALLACISTIAAVSISLDDGRSKKEVATIVSSELKQNEDGSYQLEFSSSDGTSRQEDGNLVNAGSKDEVLEVKGSYKYINKDGSEEVVHYTAGKNGFVPHGKSISPEITAAAEAARNLPERLDDDDDDDHRKNKRNSEQIPF